ncbi:PDR/VanB family oxidoreductase [Chachezhania antarctica]|uniref:PDR/VanB family oxidoreductase n=1 Tax=Chachezhania antarctica TaxID=2340860 RepID=UPI001F08BD30|nr:PDR/VanB family oxidoreductase [Chachezhania antarctica]
MTTDSLTLTVTARHDDAGNIMRLRLEDPTGAPLPPVTAGAHIDVLVETRGEAIWRQYSLAGDPADRTSWHLGILKEPASRGGSVALHDAIREGQSLRITGPRNHFALAEADHTVLIGGGVGITPMLAMGYELAARGAPFEMHYATRSADRTAFRDLLEAAPFAGHVQVYHDDANRITDAVLPPPDPCTHVYICGPQGFMDWMIGAAEVMGHASANIHREYFSADVDVSGETFEVEARASGVTVTVGRDESIVAALAREGIKIDVKCEEGICGTCITDVIDGTPDHRDQFLTDEEREEGAEICTCCSRSKTARLVLDV